MTDFNIPDDIERWEKKGLREDIDTKMEHVHDIYVWKNLAIEHEVLKDFEDKGHWNPYAIVNGHPFKLSRDYFDTFEEAVGYLKGAIKDKKLVGEDECDGDTDMPSFPRGDNVTKKSVSMRTRLAMMNDEPGWRDAYISEVENLRKGWMDDMKEENAAKIMATGYGPRDEEGNIQSTLRTQPAPESPSKTAGTESVNYQSRGKDGIASSHIDNVGDAVHSNMNGAREDSGYLKTGNPYGDTPTSHGGGNAPKPGKAQNLNKILQNTDVGNVKPQASVTTPEGEEAKGIDVRPAEDLNLRLGKYSFPTVQASSFMSNSFVQPKIFQKMLNNYNKNAWAIPSELIPITDEERDVTADDFTNLSAHQLRNILLQEYKEKDPLTGQLVRPKEMKHLPIFGGWQLGKFDDAGQPIQVYTKDGRINNQIFSMLANPEDTLNGDLNGLTANGLGIVTGTLGGQGTIRPAQDVFGREEQLQHVRGKDRLPPNDLIFAALSQAANRLTLPKDSIDTDDVNDIVAKYFGTGGDDRGVYADEEARKKLLAPYMLDGYNQPLPEDQAQNKWATDYIIDKRRNKLISSLEPSIMHWMDNLPLGQLVELFNKYPKLRRNMAMNDADRVKWYRDLFDSGAIRNILGYDGDAIADLKKYTGSGDYSSGKTTMEDRDDAQREIGQVGRTAVGSRKPAVSKKQDTKISNEAVEGMADLAKKQNIGRTKTGEAEKNRQAMDEERKMKSNAKQASMRDRIKYFDPLFVTDVSKSESTDSVVEDEVPSGKGSTDPRIASFRSVYMGEGKDSEFPMTIVDKTTGKVLLTWDGKM